MKAVHANLDIKNIHFDKICIYLGMALQDEGMSQDDVKIVENLLEPMRKDIVTVDD